MTAILERPQQKVSLSARLYTAEEVEAMPSHRRVELVRGEISIMPNNSAEHGDKTMRLSAYVSYFVYEKSLGKCFAAETRFIVERNPDTLLAPDFAFVAAERLTDFPTKGYLDLAPDLIFETRSPSDTRRPFALKIARWLSAGVKLVWAIDPATQTVTVHRTGENPRTLGIEDTLTGEDVLPGFEFALERLFR